jgi:hypothetical protein
MADRSMAERLLHAVGVDPALVDGVLGDLAEERAERSARDGKILAALWCVEQAIRSTPHLLLSAYRFGGPAARARLCAALGAVGIAIGGLGVAFALRDGPPVRIVTALANSQDGIVVNNMTAVQLPMHVLDKRGHQLKSERVHFQLASGSSMSVSPNGEITCRAAGDALVRATSGAAATEMKVLCRPVTDIRESSWIDLITGDPPRELPFYAVGLHGEPVNELRGAIHVADSSVASFDGTMIHARRAGRTTVLIKIGDEAMPMRVIVHELVQSFESLRPGQLDVARPVRLSMGDTLHWGLPAGAFWLKYIPKRASETPPTIVLEGNVGCSTGDGVRTYTMPAEEYGKYCVARPGASVLIAHGANGLPVVEGSLLLQRIPFP